MLPHKLVPRDPNTLNRMLSPRQVGCTPKNAELRGNMQKSANAVHAPFHKLMVLKA